MVRAGVLVLALVGGTLVACSRAPAPRERTRGGGPAADSAGAVPRTSFSSPVASGAERVSGSLREEGRDWQPEAPTGAEGAAVAWSEKRCHGIPCRASVRGPLDIQIIRRVIRRHISDVKLCYEQQLEKKPGLSGRLMVQFTIAPTGEVVASALQSSTMGDAKVESCTVQAVWRWEFPRPEGGGIVDVTYPFVLMPAAIGS